MYECQGHLFFGVAVVMFASAGCQLAGDLVGIIKHPQKHEKHVKGASCLATMHADRASGLHLFCFEWAYMGGWAGGWLVCGSAW